MTEHLNQLIKTLSSSWSDELWNPVSGECLNTVIKFQIESAHKQLEILHKGMMKKATRIGDTCNMTVALYNEIRC